VSSGESEDYGFVTVAPEEAHDAGDLVEGVVVGGGLGSAKRAVVRNDFGRGTIHWE
jgi:hypothetical protein